MMVAPMPVLLLKKYNQGTQNYGIGGVDPIQNTIVDRYDRIIIRITCSNNEYRWT